MTIKKEWRPAIFVVPYFINEKNVVEFLLLKRKLHWKGWEFCKGKIEKGETQKETVIRELREETGIKIKEKEIFDQRIAGENIFIQNHLPHAQEDRTNISLVFVEVKKNRRVFLWIN
jgi:8-oxo-dGTP pyrophosphatase MutT (NUDIX family)